MPLGSFRMNSIGRKRPIAAALSATGGTISIYDSGTQKYAVHTFTTDANFVVTSGGTVDALLVAAGGGSGSLSSATSYGSGGGGAGQVLLSSNLSIGAATYPIVIGQGLTGGTGGSTTALGLTAVGGGIGAGTSQSSTTGASGGGGGTNTPDTTGSPGTSGKGFAGGDGYYSFPAYGAGGGGGSASNGSSGGAGGDFGYGLGGKGGNGYNATGFHTATTTYFAAGGSGGGRGGRDNTQLGSGTNGSGANGQFNNGSARSSDIGQAGITIIRYPISSVRLSDSTFTANASGSLASTTTGKFGTALSYSNNGSSGYGQYNFGSGMNFNSSTNTAPMTIEFWFKHQVSDSQRNTMVMSNSSFGYNELGDFSIYYNSNIASWYFRLGSTNYQLTVTNNTWCHVAIQCNTSRQVSMWLNGSLRANNISWTGQETSLRLGAGYGGSNTPIGTNSFDEVRISYGNRYTAGSSFTAPTAAFTNDSNTLGLFHCQTTAQTDDKA